MSHDPPDRALTTEPPASATAGEPTGTPALGAPTTLAWMLALTAALGGLQALVVVGADVVLERVEGLGVGRGLALLGVMGCVGIVHALGLISSLRHLFARERERAARRMALAMAVFGLGGVALIASLSVDQPALAWRMLHPAQANLFSPLTWQALGLVGCFGGAALTWFVGVRARLLVPLLVSLHVAVSLGFAAPAVHGWRAAGAPPSLLVGALLSGLALLLVLVVPMRRRRGFEDVIPARGLERQLQLVRVVGLALLLTQALEVFLASSRALEPETPTLRGTLADPLGAFSGALLLAAALAPQLLWWRRLRERAASVVLVAALVWLAATLRAFVFAMACLQRDGLPSTWGAASVSPSELALLAVLLGLFVTGVPAVVRWLPGDARR
jgi:hypothetical protein